MSRLKIISILYLAFAIAANADEVTKAGRKIFSRYESSVLTIKLVINQSFSVGGRQGRKQEERSEITGTVIDDKGVIVVSLAATDPASTMNNVMGTDMGDDDARMKVDSVISDIKIAMPGGRDIPGRIVLRDKDLDLAFIVPSERNGFKWKGVDLDNASSPGLLDPIVVLNRLGHVASRVVSASEGRITAIVDKPRKYYVIDHDQGSMAMGSPVFGLDGKLVGVLAIRAAPAQSRISMAAMFSGSSMFGIIPVIVPAAQIKEAAEQVPAEGDSAQDEAVAR